MDRKVLLNQVAVRLPWVAWQIRTVGRDGQCMPSLCVFSSLHLSVLTESDRVCLRLGVCLDACALVHVCVCMCVFVRTAGAVSVSQYGFKRTVVSFLNLVTGAHPKSEEFWQHVLLPQLERRFGSLKEVSDEHSGLPANLQLAVHPLP